MARSLVEGAGRKVARDFLSERAEPREEKRVTRGSDRIRTRAEQEQLDLNDPNQRRLLDAVMGLPPG